MRKANNEAATKLEAERQKRLQLAASLLPRELDDQSGMIAKLKSFPKMTAIFEFMDDREQLVLAEEINFVLGGMGWKTGRLRIDEHLVRDGIVISPGSKFPDLPPYNPSTLSIMAENEILRSFQGQEKIAKDVARTLKDSLKDNNGIDSEIGNDAYDFPPAVLVIRIGPKPNAALEATINELGGRKPATPLPLTNFGVFTLGGRTGRNRLGINEITVVNKK